jgi:hypothetical protein
MSGISLNAIQHCKNNIVRLSATFILFLIHLVAFSQRGQITGHVTNTDSLGNFNYLLLVIKKYDSTIAETIVDQNAKYSLKNIPFGHYQLVIIQTGSRDKVMCDLDILRDTTIDIRYPPPCNFVYKKGQKPTCIAGHTDHIIPIVYGLPSKITMDKAKKSLIHLGGCIISDCDPRFYCTIHHKEL